MFEKERHIIGLHIRMNGENAQMFEKEIDNLVNHWTMKTSAICGEIGIQAAFAAATMGLATYLTTAGAFARAGGALARASQGAGTGARILSGVGSVGGISSGGAAAELVFQGILNRAAAGIGMLFLRRLTGDLGTKKAMNFEGFGSALALTVLFAWIGSPGRKVPVSKGMDFARNLGPAEPVSKSMVILRNLVSKLPETLPAAMSTQGGAQNLLLIKTGLDAWMRSPEAKPYLEDIRKNRAAFDKMMDDFANNQVSELMSAAIKGQHEIAKKVRAEAAKRDYGQMLPFFARNFDFRGNVGALTDMCLNAAEYEAKLSFWIQVGHCISELEQTVKQAKGTFH